MFITPTQKLPQPAKESNFTCNVSSNTGTRYHEAKCNISGSDNYYK